MPYLQQPKWDSDPHLSRMNELYHDGKTITQIHKAIQCDGSRSSERAVYNKISSTVSSHPSLTHDDYTVACICPLGVELAPVEAMLDEIHQSFPTSRDNHSYTLGRMGTYNVVITCIPEIGNNSAATVTKQLLNDFTSIRLGLLVGIGGGIPSDDKDDIRLGDIVISKPTTTKGEAVQFERGKIHPDGQLERTETLNKPPVVLMANVQKQEARHRRVGNQISKYLSEMLEKNPYMEGEYVSPDMEDVERAPRKNLAPRIYYGTIGSANQVVKDSETRDKLRKAVMKDAASIVMAIWSAFIIYRYGPFHNQVLDLSTNLREESTNSSGNRHSSGLPAHIDCLSRWSKQAEGVLTEKIARRKVLENITSQISSRLETLHTFQILSDPPPPLFLTSCISFAFAITAFRQSHRADCYQDRIVGAGVIVGIAAASQTGDFLMELKSYMAWSTILALVLSSLIHRILSLWSRQEKLDGDDEVPLIYLGCLGEGGPVCL